MNYSLSINSIDAYGCTGDGDVFQGDDLTLDQVLDAVKTACEQVTGPDPDCADKAFDLTLSVHFPRS